MLVATYFSDRLLFGQVDIPVFYIRDRLYITLLQLYQRKKSILVIISLFNYILYSPSFYMFSHVY